MYSRSTSNLSYKKTHNIYTSSKKYVYSSSNKKHFVLMKFLTWTARDISNKWWICNCAYRTLKWTPIFLHIHHNTRHNPQMISSITTIVLDTPVLPTSANLDGSEPPFIWFFPCGLPHASVSCNFSPCNHLHPISSEGPNRFLNQMNVTWNLVYFHLHYLTSLIRYIFKMQRFMR